MRIHHLIACMLLLTSTHAVWCGNITIARVWTEKICYKPGETAKITVDVANSGNAAVSSQVSLSVSHGLDSHDVLPAQTLTIPAKGKATVTFTYAVPPDRKWGHEVVATATEPGAEAATAREYFTVGKNPCGKWGITSPAFSYVERKRAVRLTMSSYPDTARTISLALKVSPTCRRSSMT